MKGQAKWIKGRRRNRLWVMEWTSHRNKRYSIGSMVSGTIIVLYSDSRYTCDHSITNRIVDSLCCTLETNVTLCLNYGQIQKNKKEDWKLASLFCHLGNYIFTTINVLGIPDYTPSLDDSSVLDTSSKFLLKHLYFLIYPAVQANKLGMIWTVFSALSFLPLILLPCISWI